MDKADHNETSLFSISKDIEKLKSKQESTEQRLSSLETKIQLQEQMLSHLTKSIEKIEENTMWLRQTITRAVIFGIVGGVFSILTGLIIWGITH